MVGLIAWSGPHTRHVKLMGECTADTTMHMLKVNQGERGRAMGYVNAECTFRIATPLSHSGHFGAAHKRMPYTAYGLS